MNSGFHIDYFSGSVIDLPKKDRTLENILGVLKKDPRISTFDMSENYKWLVPAIKELKRLGRIVEIEAEYPWHRFEVQA